MRVSGLRPVFTRLVPPVAAVTDTPDPAQDNPEKARKEREEKLRQTRTQARAKAQRSRELQAIQLGAAALIVAFQLVTATPDMAQASIQPDPTPIVQVHETPQKQIRLAR